MTAMTTKKARWLRRLSCVPRWAVVPTLHKQNVAEHCFHVIVLTRWLLSIHAKKDDGNFELEVLRYAIEHDADEAQSGDIPSTYKHRDQAAIDDQVKIVVKCADKLEALLYVYEEKRMGNDLGIEELWHDVLKHFRVSWEQFELHPNARGVSFEQLVESAQRISYDKNAAHPSMEVEGYAD